MQTKFTQKLSLLLCLVMLVGMLPITAMAYDQSEPYFIASSTERDYTLPAGQTMSLFDKDGMYSNFTHAYDSETGNYILDDETGEPILIRADIGKDFLYVVESGGRYYAMSDVSGTNSLRTSIPAVDVTEWVDFANGTVSVPDDTAGVMFLSYTKWGNSNFGLTANGHNRLFGYEYTKIDDEDGKFHFDLYFKFENTQKDRSGCSFSWYNDDTDADGYLTGFTDYWDRELRYHIYPVLRTNSAGMKYFGLASKHIDEPMSENAKLYALNCRHQSTVDYLPYDAPTCMDRGSEEFWYCRGCEEYFSDAALTNYIGVNHPQLEALGHDYGDEKCSRCGREVPVYKKVSSKAEFDALSSDASFIVVAEYGDKTYVLGNDQPPESEFENQYVDWGSVPAVPVTKNGDGSISVKGTNAVEFQVTPQYSSDEIDEIMANSWFAQNTSMTREDVEAIYQFITPGRFFKAPGMNKIVRNYKQMLWFEGDNRVWKVYFYNELKNLGLDSIERGFVSSMTFEDTNLLLAFHWPSESPKDEIPFEQSVRLRDYNGTVSFVAGSNYNLDGFSNTQYTDGNGNEKSTDKQAAVYLYASDAKFGHTHTYGEWKDGLNGFHIRYCTADGCTARETGMHMWGGMTSDNDKTHSHTCSVCNLSVAEAHDLTVSYNENTHTVECRYCDYSATDAHNMSIYNAWGSEKHSNNCSVCNHWCDENCNFTIPIDKTDTAVVYQCEKCANTKRYETATADSLTSDEASVNTNFSMNVPAYVEGNVNAIIPLGTVFTVAESEAPLASDVTNDIEQKLNEKSDTVEYEIDGMQTYNITLTYNDVNVQPGGEVYITIPASEVPAGDEHTVFYVDNDGNTTEHDTTANDDGSLTFTTDHLSKYTVVGFRAKTAPAPNTYSVTITAGVGMSTEGSASQTGISGAMTSVVYTADSTHYFPVDYSVPYSNGISVTRNSYTQITVSGTPTANTTIELVDATAKVKESTPEAYTNGESENSVLLNGAAPKCLYSIDGGNTWTKLNNYTVLIKNVTTEHGIWVKCPTSYPDIGLDSDIQKITITKAATPAPTVNYENVRFEDLAENRTFYVTVGETKETLTTKNLGRIKIKEEWIGKTVSIVLSGGRNELYSAPTSITLPARPTDVPTGITATHCTSDSPYIGSINGVDDRMEISLKGEDGWLKVPAGETSVRYSFGEYEVRFKATDTSFASAFSAYVMINEYVAPPATYTVTFAGGGSTGGTAPIMDAKAAEEKITLPQCTFTKDGHTFDGWNDGSAVYAAGDEYTMPAENVTFTATWRANAHTHNYSTTLTGNETHHWYECDGCNEKKDLAPHTPGAEATEDAAQTCTECGYELAPKLIHAPMLVEGYAATTKKPGKKDYYHCDGCGRNYADVTSINEITGDIEEWRYIPMIDDGGNTNTGYTAPRYYDITAKAVKNGSIDISQKSAARGATVTVTLTPDKGYTADTLTVIDNGGKEVKLSEKDGKYTFDMPASKVTVSASFKRIATYNPFTDVSEVDYFYDAVMWAVDNGITVGATPTTFAPEQSCTRSQIVTFLWRAFGSPKASGTANFSDVAADAYYADAVAWAVENGITVGTTETTFSPNEICTRAQAVTFLSRALKAESSAAGAFTDVAADAYYANAVAWAAENGIVLGTSDTTFSPDEICTRGQIVTLLFRAMTK